MYTNKIESKVDTWGRVIWDRRGEGKGDLDFGNLEIFERILDCRGKLMEFCEKFEFWILRFEEVWEWDVRF